MFDDFHNDKQYLARSVDFFERKVGITLRDARPFGGFGNMAADPKVRRGGLLLAGEAAGLQDALFGFGMRYALTSGYFAGQAWVDQDLPGYEEAYRRRIRPWIHAAAVNRYLYRRAGARGYRAVVERVCGSRDPRSWLRRRYARHWWTRLVYRIARAHAVRLQSGPAAHACREGCDCTYCRCVREAAGRNLESDVTANAGERATPQVTAGATSKGDPPSCR
jgi:flavin-dependent dehydrogenase